MLRIYLPSRQRVEHQTQNKTLNRWFGKGSRTTNAVFNDYISKVSVVLYCVILNNLTKQIIEKKTSSTFCVKIITYLNKLVIKSNIYVNRKSETIFIYNRYIIM